MAIKIDKSRYLTPHGTLTKNGASLTMRCLEAWKRGTVAPTEALVSFTSLVFAKCALSAAQWFDTFAETHTRTLEIELIQSEMIRLENMLEGVRRSSHGITKQP